MKTREELASAIEQLRKESGLSYDDLSKACGITKANLINIEKGRVSVRYDSLCAVLDALGGEIEIKRKSKAAQ